MILVGAATFVCEGAARMKPTMHSTSGDEMRGDETYTRIVAPRAMTKLLKESSEILWSMVTTRLRPEEKPRKWEPERSVQECR